jgi:hypothetical protein
LAARGGDGRTVDEVANTILHAPTPRGHSHVRRIGAAGPSFGTPIDRTVFESKMGPIWTVGATETTIAAAPVHAARFVCGGCVAVGSTTSTPHGAASPTFSHQIDRRDPRSRLVRPEPPEVDREPPIEDT